MRRLHLLAIGTMLTAEDRTTIEKSLDYFVRSNTTLSDQQKIQLAHELAEKTVIEDLAARKTVGKLKSEPNKYGYILVLGNEALRKLEDTDVHVDVVECHTLKPSEWSGEMRERIISQLKSFIQSWIMAETEVKMAEIAKADKHEVEWIIQNDDQFKRHIQLMVQNGRPHAAQFQMTAEGEAHCILRDATKRLQQPITEVVPVVAESLGTQEKILKKLEQNGYPKVFLMDIDEFMSHVRSICLQLNGEPVRIKVEANAPHS